MRWLFCLMTLCAVGTLHSEEAAEGRPGLREVRGVLLGVDGKPAAGREVRLLGLSRGFQRFLGEEKDVRWNFRTDAGGRFLVKLVERTMAEGNDTDPPGWGIYALVVKPKEGEAGAVAQIGLYEESDRPNVEADEWGHPLEVPPKGLDVTLKIERGVTLEGRLLDYVNPQKPLANVEVRTFSDLHADTHTGYGGEIFHRQTTTDGDGRFSITHIYPNTFSVEIGEAGRTIWLRTRQGRKWVDDANDVVTPAKDGTVGELEIQAATRPLFRYFGKVTDAAGKAVSGCPVTFGVSYHVTPLTHADDHSYFSAETKPDGTYEIELATPWIRGMDAQAKGYERVDRWKDDSNYPPGKYGFVMEKVK